QVQIQAIFKRGFTRLCKVLLTKIKKSHHVWMGMDTYIAYVYVRSHLDEYIHTVTAEFPPIVHCSSCQDHKGCAEDWAAVWWNGMRQLPLDGRNLQHLDEANDHFKGLQFGWVSVDCKRHMFSHIMNLNKPLAHSHQFITHIKDRLVHKIIPT
ncbi:hypothetical protein F5J12DRAFT_725396, partial [Pisolithus orientalis]|uniref:uncharacterized protein n=1 Tax=Pisolithus orientalis TaxID=936130 RepID=UPI0022254DCB